MTETRGPLTIHDVEALTPGLYLVRSQHRRFWQRKAPVWLMDLRQCPVEQYGVIGSLKWLGGATVVGPIPFPPAERRP